MKTLTEIGLPDTEVQHVRERCRSVDELREYVLCVRLLFDDRHEYI